MVVGEASLRDWGDENSKKKINRKSVWDKNDYECSKLSEKDDEMGLKG